MGCISQKLPKGIWNLKITFVWSKNYVFTVHAADFDFHFFHHFDGWKYTDFQQIIQLYHIISSKVLYVFE